MTRWNVKEKGRREEERERIEGKIDGGNVRLEGRRKREREGGKKGSWLD